jgi:hypothetical protein
MNTTPIVGHRAPPPGSWQIERRFYQEFIQLAR